MKMENWKSIPAFDGYYEASDLGRIRRIKRAQRTQCAVLVANANSTGRATVTLCVDGRRYTKMVHRLVASAFLGEPPADMQVNHLDGDPLNNKLSNLEYTSAEGNRDHAHRMGLYAHGTETNVAKLDDDSVRTIKSSIRSGESQASIARRFSVSQSTISLIASGRLWRHVL